MRQLETNHMILRKTLPEPYQLIHFVSREEGWSGPVHQHPMFQLIWVSQGTMKLSITGMDFSLRKGHICIIPPDLPHALQTETGYSQLGFDLNSEADKRGIISLMEMRVKHVVVLDLADRLSIVPEAEQKCRQLTVLALLQATHLLDGVLYDCLDTLNSEKHFRQQMIALLEQHLSGKITLEQVSQRLSFSPSHIERITRREFGCSVMELYYRLKTNKACSMLAGTGMSVKQIADALGFFDQAHFCRFFKQRMKVTPSEFKRANL